PLAAQRLDERPRRLRRAARPRLPQRVVGDGCELGCAGPVGRVYSTRRPHAPRPDQCHRHGAARQRRRRGCGAARHQGRVGNRPPTTIIVFHEPAACCRSVVARATAWRGRATSRWRVAGSADHSRPPPPAPPPPPPPPTPPLTPHPPPVPPGAAPL